MSQNQSFRSAFIAVTSLFFMWGFITVIVDAFIPRLKDVFELSYLQAGMVQMAWFSAYFFLSVPGGIMIRKVGYKKGIIIGLATAATGCLMFYPAAGERVFGLFLGALFIVAAGLTVLQVAANPYISVLGDPARASSRLNLAQAFNSLGTTIAPIISAAFLLSDKILTGDEQAQLDDAAREAYYATEAAAVQTPFLALAGGFLLLAGIIAAVKLPKILGSSNDTDAVQTGDGATAGYKRVWQDKRLRFGALGIFVYVGAEVALSSYMVNYGLHLGMAESVSSSPVLSALAEFSAMIKGKKLAEMDAKAIVGVLLALYWGGAMLGRFIGSVLMRSIAANRLLAIFGGIAASLVLLSIVTSGTTAFLALLGVGLFNSIMFPTIFSLGISKLGNDTPYGSGILCTAIVGGAFIPPTLGVLVDASGWAVALMLPIVCYAYIAWYGRAKFQSDTAAA